MAPSSMTLEHVSRSNQETIWDFVLGHEVMDLVLLLGISVPQTLLATLLLSLWCRLLYSTINIIVNAMSLCLYSVLLTRLVICRSSSCGSNCSILSRAVAPIWIRRRGSSLGGATGSGASATSSSTSLSSACPWWRPPRCRWPWPRPPRRPRTASPLGLLGAPRPWRLSCLGWPTSSAMTLTYI